MPASSAIDESTLVPMSIAPGTTLTGLYASQVRLLLLYID